MILYNSIHNGWHIRFEYSPLYEMLCSLHVLTKPEHHLERIEWAESCKNSIDSKLYSDIVEFGNNYFTYSYVMDFCDLFAETNDLNIIACIDSIDRIDDVLFVYIFFNKTITKTEIKTYLNRKNAFGNPNITTKQEEIFKDIKLFRNRLSCMLKNYYYTFFEKELRFIEPLLIRILKRNIEVFSKDGPLKYIDNLHTRIELENDRFNFYKYTKLSLDFNKIKNISIKISSFIDPHLMLGIVKHNLYLTIRAHLNKPDDIIPSDLFNLLKALGDETRLKILKVLYKDKSTTMHLAEFLKLTEACISKHLKLLHEAGVVYKERKGSFIYYYINKSIFDWIPFNIYQYFDSI